MLRCCVYTAGIDGTCIWLLIMPYCLYQHILERCCLRIAFEQPEEQMSVSDL